VLQSGALLHCILVHFWIALDNEFQRYEKYLELKEKRASS